MRLQAPTKYVPNTTDLIWNGHFVTNNLQPHNIKKIYTVYIYMCIYIYHPPPESCNLLPVTHCTV